MTYRVHTTPDGKFKVIDTGGKVCGTFDSHALAWRHIDHLSIPAIRPEADTAYSYNGLSKRKWKDRKKARKAAKHLPTQMQRIAFRT